MIRLLKRLLIVASIVVSMMIIASCNNDVAPKEMEALNHQVQEEVDAKGLQINIDQVDYTEERDYGAEKVNQVLRLKMTVRNTSIEEIFFDSTALQVTDSKGKKMDIYPFENMIENIAPKEKKVGYVYFKASNKGPYTVVYKHPITQEEYTWQVNPKN
ncbi:DUF4352 domain-containing protein [Listeria rocourtiae]|uniref:DUF4352 domain-containing protein n=1 Tax=Listeria rocourtiae TaxID=647910 RepID=UPI001625AA0C|nr:DUF4352 domain-containing protein [Listeria rocourtiae]MBC1435185.1 DUF4352 domain-containing protein [Listeria rocourtiae]